MQWNELYDNTHPPTDENIQEFINNDLWYNITTYLEDTYRTPPKKAYSGCSMQSGWNIKYQKGGKPLCILYPMKGYFIALVVIGMREMNEAELLMPLCTEYTQILFKQTISGYSGKWLMFDVKSIDILNDVKRMIALRANNK
ncbi:DUF3788 domain-containing protein [Lacrimispora indolis]|uniref:DUF3788 domain-containing protein n=1 Tax=Lacrimispora indolis TaxID=69825 RepID=UPI000462B439|nr:DUF3788 domain-containing protein [[Clostridium] methoxybenzovorans]